MAGYNILRGIGDKTKSIATTILKFFLYTFLIILVIVIIKGILKTEELVIQPIHAPKQFVEAGYQGNIIAQRLHEEIVSLYQNATTVREDSTAINVDQSKDINMNVMGLGVSASNIIYHLRDLLGVQTNYISGHLTDMNDMLSLKLSVSSPSSDRTIRLPYTENQKLEVFDSLLLEGAKFITEIQNPYRLAVYYHQTSQIEKCLGVIRKLVKSPEEKKWAYNLWANIIKQQNGYEESLEFYEMALKEDPNFKLALGNMGRTYMQMDSIDQAITTLEKVNSDSSNEWNIVNLLAVLYRRSGDTEQARKYYNINIKNNPKNMYSYSNYADFLMDQQEVDELPKLFNKAKEQNFEGDDLYLIQSGYYAMLEKLDSSEIFINKALLYNPENIEALAQKANIIHERDGGIAAIPAMKKVLALFDKKNITNDGIISVLNSLSIAEYEAGILDSADYHINRAIRLAPNYGILYTTLAEVFYLKGNKEKFYENIITAFEKGTVFREKWWDQIPYDQLKNDERLLEIIKSYKSKLPG